MSLEARNLAKLQRENERLQRENDLLRARAGEESHSRLMAEEALGDTEDRLQLALDAKMVRLGL